MIDSALLDWVVPATSIAAAVFWLLAVRLSPPYLREGATFPAEVRAPIVVAVLTVSLLLAVSSLAYPDLIPADWSRFLLLICRTTLLVTGAVTWVELRKGG